MILFCLVPKKIDGEEIDKFDQTKLWLLFYFFIQDRNSTIHPTSTYIYKMTIALKVCDGKKHK